MLQNRSSRYAGLLSEMIKVRTVSSYGMKDKSCFVVFQEKLKELFPSLFSLCEVESFNSSLLLRWRGKDSSRRVLFMNHQDVVEAEGAWKYPPFSGAIEDGKVWGRGTLDTKGGLFGMFMAAEELISEGFVPACDVYFESSCDEETEGKGCSDISLELQKRGLEFEWILDEGGMIMAEPLPGAKGLFAVVGLGEKGCVDLKFVAKSKGGHASTPPKDDCLVRLGKFMAACEKKRLFAVELTPAIQEMFRAMSISMKGPLKVLMGHPVLFKGLIERVMPSVSPMAKALLSTTLAFTQAQGSAASNVLPAQAWVVANMRTSLHQGIKDSIEKVSKLAGKFGLETEVVDPGFQSEVADVRSTGFDLIKKAVSATFPAVVNTAPYIMTGASDARFMSRVCKNCFRFVPFVIDETQLASIHGENENVDVETLVPAVDFYRFLMKEAK